MQVPVGPSDSIQYRYQTWNEWLKETFIRYWFIVLAILSDIFICLEVLRHQEISFRVELAGIIFVVMSALEIVAYLFIWGKNGIWIFDDEEEG